MMIKFNNTTVTFMTHYINLYPELYNPIKIKHIATDIIEYIIAGAELSTEWIWVDYLPLHHLFLVFPLSALPFSL